MNQVVHDTFTEAYQKLDKIYYDVDAELARSNGAVVVSVFIIGNMVYCVNLGDSRAVLSRKRQAVSLS